MVNIEVLHGKESFDDFLVSNKNEIILVIFSASWCGPCQRFKAFLKSSESEIMFPGLKVAYFDVDDEENAELCEIFEVQSLPTYFFSKLDKENSLRSLPQSAGFSEESFQKQYNVALETFLEEEVVEEDVNVSELSVDISSNDIISEEQVEEDTQEQDVQEQVEDSE